MSEAKGWTTRLDPITTSKSASGKSFCKLLKKICGKASPAEPHDEYIQESNAT